MITGINESKILRKHVSCKCNLDLMKENVIPINGGIMINVDVSVKNVMYVKKIYLESFCMQLQKWKIFNKYYR